jgi:mono/diheme cytochrome c family protein
MQRYGLGMVVVWGTLLGMALAVEQQPPGPLGATAREVPGVCVQYCSACHGVDGRRDGPAALAFQSPSANLTRMAQRHDGRFPVA